MAVLIIGQKVETLLVSETGINKCQLHRQGEDVKGKKSFKLVLKKLFFVDSILDHLWSISC